MMMVFSCVLAAENWGIFICMWKKNRRENRNCYEIEILCLGGCSEAWIQLSATSVGRLTEEAWYGIAIPAGERASEATPMRWHS